MHDEKLGLDGHYLLVEVTDTGHGIAPDKLNRVFEPFFTTKEVGQGTGLGLSQVHGFAHQSGGAVDIDSVPNQGTTVRLYLPSSPKTTRPLQSIGMETS
jgi:signal transduction histidine kinase